MKQTWRDCRSLDKPALNADLIYLTVISMKNIQGKPQREINF